MLYDVVREVAQRSPAQPLAFTADGVLTYAAAAEQATAVAAGLRERGIDRFGIAANDLRDVLVACVASAACGSEACIYPRDLDPEEYLRFAAQFDHGVVVADAGADHDGVAAVTLADLERPGAEPPADTPEHAPAMVLTTGTTGMPKGVRHDWGQLIGVVRHQDEQPGERWLMAYNPNQYGGVQVIVHVVASGAAMVLPASRRPGDVIDAIAEHGVTRASATPTFWRLLAGSLDVETAARLPLRQITMGGEAVPATLLERLRRLFPEARISQIYGATEFGTAVSVRDGRPGLPIEILDRPDTADVQLRIIDGQLHTRSRLGLRGVHGGEAISDDWRPTGDLVEIDGDRIRFVGRTSEIINVGGAKVHPLPIEELVASVPGVALAVAYGRSNPVTGQIVAVDAVAEPGVDRDALVAAIREACAALPAAGRPRRIRIVDDLGLLGNKLIRTEVAQS